ncbi:magnesium transporter [Sinorhizobium meliloti]|uniref:magnesium transporter n=1 Tax=Rhizobium meliloti TaxID=382 RepID=UPI000B4974A2|nr:magnesium transporter [Sinorhizobium meliloti]ASP93478.1 magnesium transporter [Sinorhizobium meliloti]MQX55316.1 magnesium transporter [Sinorhizobium meliloti]RVJ68644.1 magnesium transporter [Sinorhizobium meliloti]RVJ85819.1 magnesium transporter [Sinorhizobium meliloti]
MAGQDSELRDFENVIESLLSKQDGEGLSSLFNSVPLNDALRELLRLTPDERDDVLSLLPPEQAARLIDEAPNEMAVELVERLEPGKAAAIVEELHSDIQADLIGELDQEDAEAILAEMGAEEAADVRHLVEYEDDTAGGLMVAEAFTFHESDTVDTVLHRFVSGNEVFERYRGQHPYIVDREDRPIGVVSLRSLLTSPRGAKLTDIMIRPITVLASAPLDVLRGLFDQYPFLGLPVVESDGRLVGVVARAAVDLAALERSESEGLRRHGLVGDEVRSMPLPVRARRRLAWLSANIVLNVIAASVISAYEETLAAFIAIAIFLPMVSDMSGCSGNQAVAVTMRELSLGLVRPIDMGRVWIKEVSVGLINGAALGILIGIVAWMWKGSLFLGLVIGTALALNTVIAVSIGGVVPLLLKWIGQDPAAASGPLLTTITDMAGFFLVLSLATAMMPYLIQDYP